MMDSSRKDFFPACLKLQVHIVRKRLLALLAMGLAALLLSAIVVAGVHQVFSGRGFGGIRIAVASEEENEQLDVLIDLLAGMQDVKKFAVVSKAGVP